MNNENKNSLAFYGIGGADVAYAVIAWYVMYPDEFSITNIWRRAASMKAYNPSIKQVFVVDNRRGLKKDYMEANRLKSVEGYAIFKDILEREGREIKG